MAIDLHQMVRINIKPRSLCRHPVSTTASPRFHAALDLGANPEKNAETAKPHPRCHAEKIATATGTGAGHNRQLSESGIA
jgi:hypothetical protein